MQNHIKPRLSRIAVGAATVAAVVSATFAHAPSAYAATAQSPKYFDRKAVMARAAEWTRKAVPYSQTSWLDGYRTDCSGFVSKAWNLDQSYVTWSLPEVSKRITKADLQPGDIMLDTSEHVILFGGWTDSNHSHYTAYEQVGGPFQRTMKRVVPFPYDGGGSYKPYRYTGGHSLTVSGVSGPYVQTYAGNGQTPLVPGPAAARTNTQRHAAEKQHILAVKAKVYAKQRAEKATVRGTTAGAAKADATKRDRTRSVRHGDGTGQQRTVRASEQPLTARLGQAILAMLGA